MMSQRHFLELFRFRFRPETKGNEFLPWADESEQGMQERPSGQTGDGEMLKPEACLALRGVGRCRYDRTRKMDAA